MTRIAFFNMVGEIAMARRMCTNMAHKTCLTRARHSPRERSEAFQVANLRKSLSMSSNNWDAGTLRVERGRPRYWMGKQVNGQASVSPTVSAIGVVHWIEVAEHLAKLVWIPEKFPKRSKSSLIAVSSEGSGWQKITTSSMKREMLKAACRLVSLFMIPE